MRSTVICLPRRVLSLSANENPATAVVMGHTIPIDKESNLMHFREMVGFIWGGLVGTAVVFLSFSPLPLKHSDYFQPKATHREKKTKNKKQRCLSIYIFFLNYPPEESRPSTRVQKI